MKVFNLRLRIQVLILVLGVVVLVVCLYLHFAGQLPNTKFRSYTTSGVGIRFTYPREYGDVLSTILISKDGTGLVQSGVGRRLTFQKSTDTTVMLATNSFIGFKLDAYPGEQDLQTFCPKPSTFDANGNGCILKTLGGRQVLVRSEYVADEGVYNLVLTYSVNLTQGEYQGLKVTQSFPAIYSALNSATSDASRQTVLAQYARDLLGVNTTSPFSVTIRQLEGMIASLKYLAKANTQVQVNADVPPPSASTWLTYDDERDGFFLSYPATWKIAHGKVETGNDRGIWLYSEASPSMRYQLSITVDSNPKHRTAEQWVNSLQPVVDARTKVIGTVQIGSYNGYAITNVFAGDAYMDSWYLAQGGDIYRFDFPVAEANENLPNPIENNTVARQIISTFLILPTTRPADQVTTIVATENAGPQFLDPFLSLQVPLPESMEAGIRSVVDGWDSLTIVPAGNADKLPTYPFVIDYRTRKSQRIADVPSLLQTLFKQSFNVEKSVTIVGQTVQQYKSNGTGEAYRAVIFTRQGQDILIVARAQNESTMPSYIGAYDTFLSGLVVRAKQ